MKLPSDIFQLIFLFAWKIRLNHSEFLREIKLIDDVKDSIAQRFINTIIHEKPLIFGNPHKGLSEKFRPPAQRIYEVGMAQMLISTKKRELFL